LKRNIVKILKEKCKCCELCISECPQQIISISNEMNSHGYHPVYITNPDLCTGCKLCAITCPDCAIEIIREED